MARIAEIQDITPKALSEFLELTTPAVTAITTGLVERGLIVRVAHPNDRRSLFLQLTTAGHDVMETTYRSFQTAITVSAETLDAAQTAALESALSDLARSLGRYGTAARSIAAE
jgi:MarR family 2-MHQ and catechol resistance regulon transcriptional repressor